jgi:hypothetical protein
MSMYVRTYVYVHVCIFDVRRGANGAFGPSICVCMYSSICTCMCVYLTYGGVWLGLFGAFKSIPSRFALSRSSIWSNPYTACMNVCMYASMYVCIVNKWTNMFARVCMYAGMCSYMYVCTNINIIIFPYELYIYANVSTHTHTPHTTRTTT